MAELDLRHIERRNLENVILQMDFERGPVDISASPLTVNTVSSPTLTNGGANFNGGYYTVANTSKLTPSGTQCSIALSYNASAQFTNAAYYYMVNRDSCYNLYIYNRGGNFEVIAQFLTLNSYSPSTYWYQSGWGNTGTTWHVSASFDSARTNGQEIRLFRNGVYLTPSWLQHNASLTGNFYAASTALNIGRGSNGQVGNVTIDNVLITKTAWTDAEHLEVYNNWRSRTI